MFVKKTRKSVNRDGFEKDLLLDKPNNWMNL